jgi:hypothetical protein
MRVAQVGASQPLTPDDGGRIVAALELVRPLVALGKLRSEVINIEYGRDFLCERRKYGVVIVHSVFHTRPDFMEMARGNPAMARQISPLHSVDNWRKRLASSGATAIVLFESLPFSLGGWHVNEIPGYKILKRTHQITVYACRPVRSKERGAA